MNENPSAETGEGNAPRVISDREVVHRASSEAWPRKDSWTCEHFEPPTHEEIEDARREAMLDAQAEYAMQREVLRGDYDV